VLTNSVGWYAKFVGQRPVSRRAGRPRPPIAFASISFALLALAAMYRIAHRHLVRQLRLYSPFMRVASATREKEA